MKTRMIASLFIVGPIWLAGCEYYAAARLPVMPQAEQESAVEGQESHHEAAQDIKDLQDPNETLRAELEKEKQDLEKTIADLQDELEKAKADAPEMPKPDSGAENPRVITPRAEQMAQIPDLSIPVEEELSKLVLGDAETELDRVGGEGGTASEAFSRTMDGVDCAINKIVTDSSAVLDHISFSFEEPENIADGIKGFYDREVSFGGVPNGNTTSIIPPSQYVFTGFVAFACPRPKGWDISDWGAKPRTDNGVICGFRPIAKKLERTGIVEDVESLWIGPAVGTPGITTGDLFGPKIVHSIASGDAAIKMIVASGKSSCKIIDDRNVISYEICPAGQVLSGFKGAAGTMVDRLIGVCRPIVVSKGN